MHMRVHPPLRLLAFPGCLLACMTELSLLLMGGLGGDREQGLPIPALEFRFFCNMYGVFVPNSIATYNLRSEVQRTLRSGMTPADAATVTVVVNSGLSAQEYMAIASFGHVALDSFPFGGCNTVMVSSMVVMAAAVGVPLCVKPAGQLHATLGRYLGAGSWSALGVPLRL